MFLSRLNEISGGCEKIFFRKGSSESRKTLEQKFIFQIGNKALLDY